MGYSQGNNSMSNNLCLYKRGHFTEPEMCGLWQKISISYNSGQFSVEIASVGFSIDCVTTQHAPKCAENCSDNKVSYNCPSNSYQIFWKLGYNSENSVFFSPVDKLFVLKGFIPCAQTVTLR